MPAASTAPDGRVRILMLNYEFPPLGAGGSTSSFNLARNVVALGHEVDVVTMGFRGVPNEETMDGIRVFRVPSVRARREVCHTHEMATYVASGTLKAASLAGENQYDLCNAHFIFPTGPIAYAHPTAARAAVRADGARLGRAGPQPEPLPLRPPVAAPGLARPGPRRRRGGGRLAPPGEPDRGERAGRHGRDDPERVQPARPGRRRGRARPTSTVRNGRMRVLMVTRLHEFKGVQYMLEAASRVSLDLEVNIVGDGPYRPTLEAQAARIGKPVRFWGWLDRSSPDMWRLYRESSVFVFPSEREGSPTVVQEAMSAGLAVVAADAAGTPEVVGDAGILVSPKDPAGIADALVRLAENPALVQELGERARERVRDGVRLARRWRGGTWTCTPRWWRGGRRRP